VEKIFSTVSDSTTATHAASAGHFDKASRSAVADPSGAIPITTSGKVRRSACVERYRRDQFCRVEAAV
jgi:acyl-CoA synthetase (AMP-forming)/AMP-acid ligase II